MSYVHTNLISDARILINDILSESTDSIEKGLSRTGKRIAGAIFGCCPLLVLNLPSCICLFDAITDEEKLKRIHVKLMNLEVVELDKNSPDYEKALIARNFQKEIYENVRNDTFTAQKIKNIASLGFFFLHPAATILLAQYFRKDGFSINPESEIDLGKEATFIFKVFSTELLVFLPFAAYGHRWMSERAKLNDAKPALAKQVLNQLTL